MRVALQVQVEELWQALLRTGTSEQCKCSSTSSTAEPAETTSSESVSGVPAADDGHMGKEKIWQIQLSKAQRKKMRKLSSPKEPSGRKQSSPEEPSRPSNQEAPRDAKDPPQANRQVFLYGDGNAGKMKYAVAPAAKWSKFIHYKTKKDVTLQVLQEVDEAKCVWSVPEAMVILHAGLYDIVRNTSPEEVARKLSHMLQAWQGRASKHRFIVYGVPEGFRDEAFRVICKQWNQQETSA